MNLPPAHAPSLRPLARGLLLALSAMSAGAALAGDLDGQTAEVVAGDAVEAWTLENGSKLTVTGAQTDSITSTDSSVFLSNTTIASATAGDRTLVRMYGNSALNMTGSIVRDGTVTVHDTASAHIVGSRINSSSFIGIDLTHGAFINGTTPSAIVDSSFVRAELSAGASELNNGHGVRMFFGDMTIQNGSRIEGGNTAAYLTGRSDLPEATGVLSFRVDNSVLKSDSSAAIRVAPFALLPSTQFDITVANGAQLIAGDGNLLLFRTDKPAVGPGEGTVNFTVDDARLIGNVNFDTATTLGALNVSLRNKAQIDGRFINVTSASIDSDSTWLMTGDSNVGHLALGNTGTVALGNGSTFNTLTVDSFDGAGGTLLFNTQLGDDSSATDTLIIKGDSNGQANVRVLNAGGAGAKTDKGIELIRVGGASNAQFDLQGRAVGGQYEYFLFKDATNGGWYLRSELAGVPDPCVADPTLPECKPIDPVDPVDPVDPTPVLRPEAGAYLANQFAMDQLLRHGWRDRQGGSTSTVDGVRGWARVDATQSKLSAVEDQLDLRVDRSRLQLGADIGVFDNGQGRVGLMGTLAKSDATSRSQLTGYSARGKVNGGALGVYGNWSNDALYVDASAQRGQFRNRVQGEGLAEERYDSDIWQSSLEAGYRIGIGQIGRTALSLQPELQLVYTDANTDRHQETNGTVVRSLGDSGLSGRVGLRLQGESRSAAGASVSPYVVANWYRDGASNGMAFDDEALKAGVPRNRYELNAGARVDFRSGLSAWGGFGVMRGDHGYREATANLSMSYRW
ncbi:autotransporter outer membrane beta-barrel domain-containing protein [Stenotrophomonas maltophilia]|uniref:autotransporter family protein n=1 Tax=Stenotrophomonas maltophilia TaxID=40324 RepID=UPI00209B7364|nr:autotransporter outer membrane beta-barrel domain-containing protein [Stenotrophomonas maltophilia]MCO7489486.1 autotransporter outer membrane beta-barrel domain-containing protein [Stenotrophomonas maltophilia]